MNARSRTGRSEGLRHFRALRDLIDGEPDEKLAKALAGIAASAPADIQREARYAMAQFGDRSFVDPRIATLEKQTESDQDASRGEAFAELADIHYQLRDYESAVAAYKQYVALLEEGKIDRKRVGSIFTLYYNACCSMALAGMTDDAFAFLHKAIDEGRKAGETLRRRLLEVDMDIDSLRQDPRFTQVLAAFDGKK